MRLLLAGLFAIALISPAAAGLPNYNATDICAPAAMPGCWQAQLQAKALIERLAPAPQLLTYCLADAAYRGPNPGAAEPGYIQIMDCVERERWAKQVKSFDQAIGGWQLSVLAARCDDYGDKKLLCIAGELAAALNLHAGEHDPLSGAAFSLCLNQAKDARTYMRLDSCLKAAAVPQN